MTKFSEKFGKNEGASLGQCALLQTPFFMRLLWKFDFLENFSSPKVSLSLKAFEMNSMEIIHFHTIAMKEPFSTAYSNLKFLS